MLDRPTLWTDLTRAGVSETEHKEAKMGHFFSSVFGTAFRCSLTCSFFSSAAFVLLLARCLPVLWSLLMVAEHIGSAPAFQS